MAIPTTAHLAPLLDTQELRAAFVKFPTLVKASRSPLRPAAPLAQPHPSPSHTLHPATRPLTTYHSPPTTWQAFEVVQRSVWAAMDDGTSEAEIFAIADKVLLTTDLFLFTTYCLLSATRYLLTTYHLLPTYLLTTYYPPRSSPWSTRTTAATSRSASSRPCCSRMSAGRRSNPLN